MGFGPDGYYSLREILGYGAEYNIILSERGIGKSYGTKLWLVNQEGTSMCLYRQEPDMVKAREDWLEPLRMEGWDMDRFAWEGSDKKGWTLTMDGLPKIWFRYLTQVNAIKQEVFPDDMNWIWMDEFIPLKYTKLPGVVSEGDAIRAIKKTIEHDTIHSREERGLKPVRMLMFANPFTWNNPILAYFKVTPRYGIHRVGPGIVCEHVKPSDRDEGGPMTADDFLGDEVNKNRGWVDETAFIAPVPKGAEPRYSVRLDDAFFWIYHHGALFYVKKANYHHRGDLWLMGSFKGLREGETCLETYSGFKQLQAMAWNGRYRYQDINTKFEFINRLENL